MLPIFFFFQGYSLEDATALSLNGDIDIESIFASSLPNSHPSFAPERYLEMSEQWKAPPLPTEPVELFIGILSAASHFAERMAVRKSWMMYTRKSSNIVARFFVALVTTTTFSHQMFLLICKLQNTDWNKEIRRMEKRKLMQSSRRRQSSSRTLL